MSQSDLEIANGGAAEVGRGGIRAVSRSLRAAARGGCTGIIPAARRDPETPDVGNSAPIWLAALVAVNCEARRHGMHHDVSWNTVAGRAVYTNFSGHTEMIEPLGVILAAGETLAVHWMPGETAYAVEVYSDAVALAG